MVRVIIIIFIIYAAFQLFKKLSASIAQTPGQKPLSSRGEDLVEDPQCHTYIPLSHAYKTAISGRIYYFCSKKCFDTYIAIDKDDA